MNFKFLKCNRTACSNEMQGWWNRYTEAFYCQPCAFKINAGAGEEICTRAHRPLWKLYEAALERLEDAERVCALAEELNKRDLYGIGRHPLQIMEDIQKALLIWKADP